MRLILFSTEHNGLLSDASNKRRNVEPPFPSAPAGYVKIDIPLQTTDGQFRIDVDENDAEIWERLALLLRFQ